MGDETGREATGDSQTRKATVTLERGLASESEHLPFYGHAWGDLKVRVSAFNEDRDHIVSYYFDQDFHYFSLENHVAPERQAWAWHETLSSMDDDELQPASRIVVSDVDTQAIAARGHSPHVDVLITLGEWIGAGTVSVLIERIWTRLRESHPTRVRGVRRDPITRAEAEEWARWAVLAEYFDSLPNLSRTVASVERADHEARSHRRHGLELDYELGKAIDSDRKTLKLESESVLTDGFRFVFRGPKKCTFDVTLRAPRDQSFLVVAELKRTRKK